MTILNDDKGRESIHILVLGQSNVANHGQTMSRCDWGRTCFDGEVLALRDPVPGGSGNGGSVWTRFSRQLRGKGLADELFISLCAQGGTSVADWSLGGRCYRKLVENDLPATRGCPKPPTHIVYHQGERDTFLKTSSHDYLTAFDPLHRLLCETFPHALIMVCTASYRKGVTSDAVRSAQTTIQRTKKNCVAGVDTDMFGREYRYDDTHLNDRGLEAFARALLDAFGTLRGG